MREMLIKEFPDVFDGQVKVMPGEKFRIELMDNAVPFCVRAPRTIPKAYQDKLREELDEYLKLKIIAPQTKPTDWCHPIAVTLKKNGRIRLNIDLIKLNKYVKRERYLSSTPIQEIMTISEGGAKYYTSVDAMKGYHQCELEESSQDLTTFITPFGRFKFLRAPYGICSISEHYNRRMDEAFKEMKNIKKVVDDVLIYDKTWDEHVDHVRQVLSCCRDKGISLNKDKFCFGEKEVLFAGYHISEKGYRISDAITEAIAKFPTPSCRKDLKSYMGLVNQTGHSTKEIAKSLEPLRPLMTSKNDFLWTANHDVAFQESREKLSKIVTLTFFDMRKPTRVRTDASKAGLGFLLQQKHGDCWKCVQAGSRFLTSTESRYAVIEQEMLGVAWALHKCKYLVKGLPNIEVITDHSPLVPIINNHRLDEIENPRLLRLRIKMQGFNLTAKWEKGIVNEAADALSRNPVSEPNEADQLASLDVASIHEIRCMQEEDHVENLRLAELRDHTTHDEVYQTLLTMIKDGFPDKKSETPEKLKPYWSIRESLTCEDDLILYGCRLIIPHSLRATMLTRLHDAHQGVNKSRQRAQLTMYWPGMSTDIENYVRGCKFCQDKLPQHPPEPLVQKARPLRPFQEIAADFASYGGRNFLIVVDCKTDWPDVFDMGRDTAADRLINRLRNLFCSTAIPDVLWSDNGPQFTAGKLQRFFKEWGIIHKTSSPHYPQSNGKAEVTVKLVKKMIGASWKNKRVDEDKLCKALLQYRNTPCGRDNLSPAQKLFGQPIQDFLPVHNKAFAPEWQKTIKETETKADKTTQYAKEYHDQHARSLPEFGVGTQVAVFNPKADLWNIYGTIVEVGAYRRYRIKTQAGRLLVRNRRFLRKRNAASLVPSSLPNEPMPTEVIGNTPRRSTRIRKPPDRLVCDPNWP